MPPARPITAPVTPPRIVKTRAAFLTSAVLSDALVGWINVVSATLTLNTCGGNAAWHNSPASPASAPATTPAARAIAQT